MTINNGQKCQAPECVYLQRELAVGDYFYSITHLVNKVSHYFHKKCFMLMVCQDHEYMKTGRPSACPFCHEGLSDLKDDYPTREEVAQAGFIHYIQSNQFDAAAALMSLNLVPHGLIEWASTKGFSQVFPSCRSLQQDDPASASASSTSDPSSAAVHSQCKIDTDSLHEAIELFLHQNPECTAREFHRYMEGLSGQKISFAIVQKAHRDLQEAVLSAQAVMKKTT